MVSEHIHIHAHACVCVRYEGDVQVSCLGFRSWDLMCGLAELFREGMEHTACGH